MAVLAKELLHQSCEQPLSFSSEMDEHLSPLAQKILSKVKQENYLRQVSAAGKSVVGTNPGALTYQGLHPMSLALAGIRPSNATRKVNLVLPKLSVDSLFAGVKTALDVGYAIALQKNLPLRIIAFGSEDSKRAGRAVEEMLARRGRPSGQQVEVIPVNSVSDISFSDSDVWVATFWTTAHALDVACRLGLIDPSRVVYLVQDYEPGFLPWSTDHSIASATYSAGFVPLVNSSPLRSFLSAESAMEIPEGHTFRPQLDMEKLALTAEARQLEQKPKILFYGRPSKPRNMFRLGVSALRAASRELESSGLNVAIESIGEPHVRVPLHSGQHIHALGKMAWDEYFSHLSTSLVTFSLQASPHPSHPPLDAVVSGGFAVMNEIGGTRDRLHSRLHAVEAETETLAEAVVNAVQTSLSRTDTPMFDSNFLSTLGDPLEQTIGTVAAALAD